MMAARTLVLGLGNILLRDEGLGVRAVERLLTQYRLPAEVEAIDGGTLGLTLLPYIELVDRLLIVDALRADKPPGSLTRLEGEAIPTVLALKLSMHQLGLQELLVIGRIQGTLPQRIVLWGLEPMLMQPGLELTEAVAAQIDSLVAAVVGELQAWGHEVTPTRVQAETSA